MIFHITTPEYWSKWDDRDHYEAPTQAQEGFMHLCTEEQIAGVLERYFEGIDVILLLHINPDRLQTPLKWEPASNGENFPHLYGPLYKSAIEGMESLTRAVG